MSSLQNPSNPLGHPNCKCPNPNLGTPYTVTKTDCSFANVQFDDDDCLDPCPDPLGTSGINEPLIDLDEENARAVYENLLNSNEDLRELAESFENPPAWLWPILREIGIELVSELAKRQFKKFNITDDIVDALKAIPQGDLFEFLDNAKDILANFSYPIKLVDAIWDSGKLGFKAKKVIGQIGNMYGALGGEAMDRLFNAMNLRSTNLLASFDVSDGAKGLKIASKSIGEFWDDIQRAFGNPSLEPDGRVGLFFEIGMIRINWYPIDDAYGTPAISIGKGNNTIYKFRTP